MSEKRKYEEFLDPDYPQNAKLARTSSAASESNQLTSEERTERIRAIIKREFQREIAAKEQEIMEIDNRIQLARKLLQHVRYAVVSNYYTKKGMELQESEAQQCIESLGLKSTAPPVSQQQQRAVHPALRSILGKQTVDFDELLRARPAREAAKTARTSIKQKLLTKKEEKRLQRAKNGMTNTVICHDDEATNDTPKIPRHVAPNQPESIIPQLNIARSRNQTKQLIAAGNTSKYVGNEKTSDGATHKWLVYVKTKTKTPIEKILTKVRFFLHPSYRPNDIVEVCQPPFQLSRRGWGEFPIRLQLFFEPSLQQKPVQLVHNLVLDKTLSGLQTMGAETVVQIWLRTEQTLTTNSSDDSSENDDPTDDHIEDNFLEFLNRIETRTSKSICEEEKIEPTISVPITAEAVDTGSTEASNCIRDQAFRQEIKQEKDDLDSVNDRHFPVLVNQIKEEPGDRTNDEAASKTSIAGSAEERNDEPQKSCIISTGKLNLNPTQTVAQRIFIGNHEKGTTTFDQGSKSSTPAPSIPPITQPQIFQKRLIKCIDKQGNVKYIEMLVKSPSIQNGQTKPVFITKINGRTASTSLKPVALPIPSPSPNEASKSAITLSKPASSTLPPMLNLKLVPPPKENLTNLPTPKAQSTNKNQVLVRNGKMYIVDPLKTKLKQQTQKQESLLKPQISLLKPIVKNDNLNNCLRNDAKSYFNHTAIATDHDYTSLSGKSSNAGHRITIYKPPSQAVALLQKQKSSIVTVNSPNNSRINVIVTKVEDDDDNELDDVTPLNSSLRDESSASEIRLSMKTGTNQKSIALMQKPRRNYRQELENAFAKLPVMSIRQLVVFLLKQLPMINAKAASIDYTMSFPFIVKDQDAFNRMTTPKLKAFEWLRAKYIHQLLKNHPQLDSTEMWTTKEIVVFARLHAYTPVINYKSAIKQTFGSETDETLKDLIKKEIKREKYDIETVTLVHETYEWINIIRQKINRELDVRNEIIDVDRVTIDDEDEISMKLKGNVQSPLKNLSGKYFHPIESSFDTAVSLVNEVCHPIGIRLKPEEILSDVVHPSAELVLAQSLKSFLADLLRRAAAHRADSDLLSLENTIRPDDVRNAILSRPQWDFLTNNGLGIAKTKEPID